MTNLGGFNQTRVKLLARATAHGGLPRGPAALSCQHHNVESLTGFQVRGRPAFHQSRIAQHPDIPVELVIAAFVTVLDQITHADGPELADLIQRGPLIGTQTGPRVAHPRAADVTCSVALPGVRLPLRLRLFQCGSDRRIVTLRRIQNAFPLTQTLRGVRSADVRTLHVLTAKLVRHAVQTAHVHARQRRDTVLLQPLQEL